MSQELQYPLGQHYADRLKTPTGRNYNDLTFAAALSGEITAEDLRITPETLELQAQIAEKAGRPQLAENFRRSAELTAIPDARILEFYNSLRPGASSYEELIALATELEDKYRAKRNGALVRDAAEVYKRRGCLSTP